MSVYLSVFLRFNTLLKLTIDQDFNKTLQMLFYSLEMHSIDLAKE
jgi:hypothetical protein